MALDAKKALAIAQGYTDEVVGSHGGTTNYNVLSNKPKINNVELAGNKTSSDLGLVEKIEGKELSTNDYTNEDKEIVSNVTEELSGKANDSEVYKKEEIDELLETTKTATGSIVTVEDASPINAEDVTVELTPVQDLHGYDRPWAGGAGKNLIDQTTLDLYDVTGKGTMRAGYAPIELAAGAYTVSWTSANTTVFLTNITDEYSYLMLTNGGNFTLDSTSEIMLRTGATSVGDVSISNIQLESGSTATPYAPYSNICPISGFTEGNVSVSGKNLFDEANPDKWIFADGNLTDYVGSMTSQLIKAKEGQTYILSSTNSTSTLCICFYDSEMNLLNRTAMQSVGQLSATAPSNSVYMYASSFRSNNNLQLEFGATATEYVPYNPNSTTATISWEDEVGTVYGGTLDVTTGLLTVDRAEIASYAGETLAGEWISDRDAYQAGDTPTTGAQVVYELATPQTYQLTPTAVKMLLNYNNIWANSGDTTLEYQPNNVIGDLKGNEQKLAEEIAKLTNVPSEDGTYILTATVSSGVVSYEWVEQE